MLPLGSETWGEPVDFKPDSSVILIDKVIDCSELETSTSLGVTLNSDNTGLLDSGWGSTVIKSYTSIKPVASHNIPLQVSPLSSWTTSSIARYLPFSEVLGHILLSLL